MLLGDELRITAVISAYPSVGVAWYRDGVRLRASRRAVMTLDRDGQAELALPAAAARDAGVYTCAAVNELGRAETSGRVLVLPEGGHASAAGAGAAPPAVLRPDVP